jgi:hypothetical protein
VLSAVGWKWMVLKRPCCGNAKQSSTRPKQNFGVRKTFSFLWSWERDRLRDVSCWHHSVAFDW